LELSPALRQVTDEVRYARSSAQSGDITREYLVDEDAVFTKEMLEQAWVRAMEKGRRR
jgi:hypothetical protein